MAHIEAFETTNQGPEALDWAPYPAAIAKRLIHLHIAVSSTYIVLNDEACQLLLLRKTEAKVYPPWNAIPLGEGVFEVSKLRDSRPCAFIGCSKYSEDLEQLINLLQKHSTSAKVLQNCSMSC